MVEQNIWSHCWIRRRTQVRGGIRDKCKWPGIIPVVMIATIMCPWPGTAGEDIMGKGRLQAGLAATGWMAASQLPSNPGRQEPAQGFAADDPLKDRIATRQRRLTSAERRVLAASLGALKRQAGLSGSKQLISAAMGAKTEAVNRQNLPVVSPYGPSNDEAAIPGDKHTEFEEALAREKDRAATLQQQLTAAQQHIATLEASEARVAELETMLGQERERADTAHRQVNALQEQLSVLMAGGAKMLADLMREQEQSALTVRRLEAALRMIEVLESRTGSMPGTLAIQDSSLVLFGPPGDKSSDAIDEASTKARGRAETEAAPMHLEAVAAQPAAEGPSLQANVQPQMQGPGITAEADTLQKRGLSWPADHNSSPEKSGTEIPTPQELQSGPTERKLDRLQGRVW